MHNAHISQKEEVKKNKQMLNEWQQQTKIMQAEKNMSVGGFILSSVIFVLICLIF